MNDADFMDVNEIAASFVRENDVYTLQLKHKKVILVYDKGQYYSDGEHYIKQHARRKLGEQFTIYLARRVIERVMEKTHFGVQK